MHTISFPRYGQGLFANLIESYLRGDFAPRAADVDPRLAALHTPTGTAPMFAPWVDPVARVGAGIERIVRVGSTGTPHTF